MTTGHAKLKKDFRALHALHKTLITEREHLRQRNQELVAQTVRLERDLADQKSARQFESQRNVFMANELRDQIKGLRDRLDLSQKALYTLIEKMK